MFMANQMCLKVVPHIMLKLYAGHVLSVEGIPTSPVSLAHLLVCFLKCQGQFQG